MRLDGVWKMLSTRPRVGPFVKGALSFPFERFRSTYGNPALSTSDAEHCYSIFLRHLSYVAADAMPACVAELGPGSSIGVGLAALIAGAERYVALDSHWHMDTDRTLRIFARLVELFQARRPVPQEGNHAGTFPPALDDAFPAGLQPRLDDAWLAELEHDIRHGGERIRIAVPWTTSRDIAPDSVDWLLSHSCLEHIDGVPEALRACWGWLRPGARMTHEIDHRSHNLTAHWDGHWGLNEAAWYVLRGRRHYLINRLPHSYYVAQLRSLGFDIELDLLDEREPTVTPRPHLGVDEADRRVAMSFVVARKPA